MMIKSLAFISVGAAFLTLNACRWSSEQGPVRMNAIHKAQKRGEFNTDEYKIIDITRSNIAKYNKPQVIKGGDLPQSISVRPIRMPFVHMISSPCKSSIQPPKAASEARVAGPLNSARLKSHKLEKFRSPTLVNLTFWARKSLSFKMQYKKPTPRFSTQPRSL